MNLPTLFGTVRLPLSGVLPTALWLLATGCNPPPPPPAPPSEEERARWEQFLPCRRQLEMQTVEKARAEVARAVRALKKDATEEDVTEAIVAVRRDFVLLLVCTPPTPVEVVTAFTWGEEQTRANGTWTSRAELLKNERIAGPLAPDEVKTVITQAAKDTADPKKPPCQKEKISEKK